MMDMRYHPLTFREYTMNNAIHFVGFKDDRYFNAIRVFGKPDFIHRFWDRRAQLEVQDNDIVVFANTMTLNEHAYDDSAFF